VIYNPSYLQRGALLALDDAEVEKSIMVSGYGGYLVAQRAVRRMEPTGAGTILFTGASASIKG
jgi:NAD(P)-dependent dehydrogenase (short-subunit alcohol dehydrogenase family)